MPEVKRALITAMMPDSQINELCAEAVGLTVTYAPPGSIHVLAGYDQRPYNALTDDALANALVRRFEVELEYSSQSWVAHIGSITDEDASRNRAIALCVARMRAPMLSRIP